MWNSFLNLFGLNGGGNEGESGKKKVKYWRDTILNDASPQASGPPGISVQLWAHQKAMLSRCNDIERNPVYAKPKVLYTQRYLKNENVRKLDAVALGIMNDPPGAGKTFVVLSLIALDTKPSLNIIIAPKNIIKQWEDSIKKMFPDDKMRYCVANYEAINRLYMQANAFAKYRIVLLEQSLCDTFALAWNAPVLTASSDGDSKFKSKVNRVIIDEIDNVANCMTQPIESDMLWFISASFDPDNEVMVESLPYEMDAEKISNAICCTSQEFMRRSINIDDPVTEIIKCDSNDVALFKDIIDIDIMKALHAGNNRPLIRKIQCEDLKQSCYTLAKAYAEYLKEVNEKRKSLLHDLEAQLEDSIDDVETDGGNNLNRDATILQCQQIKEEIEKNKNIVKTINERVQSYSPPQVTKTDAFKEVVQRMTGESGGKWLVFNDELSALIDAQRTLENKGIKNSMLDGGNMKAVEETLEKFKNGDLQVLLINSASEGCGLNLENATHIVFMHATNPALVEQIVGRAQRFGRVGKLRIIGLFNDLELADIQNSAWGPL